MAGPTPAIASIDFSAPDGRRGLESQAPRHRQHGQAEGHPAMATITAAMVKDLRESTGAGMMDCKAALTETGGDMTAAQDWLRKKGLSKAAKKAGRVAAEGLIGALTKGTKGVVVEVNSETDFVARNGQFQGLVKMVAQVAFDVGADVEKIKAAKVGDVTIEAAINDAIATIGENMTLRRAASLEVTQGVVSSYVHGAVVEGAGKMGVIVALESPGKADELAALGRQIAMHVAATNPLALEPSGLDPAVVKREKDVLADKYRQQGKPENVIEKIVESGLKTYYKEVCLLEQAFIHDTGKSVAQAVKEAEGKVGGAVKIAGFVRYALGEGIEKQESDFAAEVAAASGKK
jgi:elongation factor Ts